MKGTYFISGIDTNIGKTIVTGYLAHQLQKNGVRVITQKMIQTGNTEESEDILLHRQLMNIDHFPEDQSGLTAPCILSYPCSPHLAAKIDNTSISVDDIKKATEELEQRYEVVLLEGAGGLMVPITEEYLTIDYIKDNDYPLIFVTSARLGSLNHTLLNFELIKHRNIKLEKVYFNLYPEGDTLITEDSIRFIKKILERDFPSADFETIGRIE